MLPSTSHPGTLLYQSLGAIGNVLIPKIMDKKIRERRKSKRCKSSFSTWEMSSKEEAAKMLENLGTHSRAS